MKGQGEFDSSLQMFVQRTQTLDLGRLRFLRWLAEQGKLEHAIAGRPSGPLVEDSAEQIGTPRAIAA